MGGADVDLLRLLGTEGEAPAIRLGRLSLVAAQLPLDLAAQRSRTTRGQGDARRDAVVHVGLAEVDAGRDVDLWVTRLADPGRRGGENNSDQEAQCAHRCG
jgi:hypothetical protein